MRYVKKIFFTLLLTITMVTSSVTPITYNTTIVQAATIKISKKTLALAVGETKSLIISGTNKKVTWSSNKKTVATVSSKGKVTAKAAGDSTITATVNGKKFICKVTVTDAVSSATKR
jgi:Bacterial surface proteins containing Ig-like domains